jgi:hypothetical protein
MYEDEVEESVVTAVRVKPSLDLMGKKYDYTECHVTCVNGDDIDVQFMDYTFNFAKMDGSGLDAMLKAILFNIEFPNANQLDYAYGETAFNVPISVDSNKLTVKMSEKEPALKDVVFYTFQSEDDNQLHLCMDKTSFVNFYTNMQVMLMQATDEQFDISDTDAVNAIYNKINNAVETIKLNIVMTKVAE